jgi:hypothetical protein
VPAGLLNAVNESAIDLLHRLVAREQGLAIVQSTDDGNLRVQYRVPVAVTDWENAAFDIEYTSLEHQLNYNEKWRDVEEFNDVVVMTEEAASQPRQWQGEYEETDYKQGIFTLYAQPWLSDGFRLEHSGDVSILITTPELILLETEETVEFKNGVSSVQHPIYRLDNVTWQHRDLGDMTWQLDSTELLCNSGYSTAKIRYTRRLYQFKIQHHLQQPETTQFLVIEE